MLGVRPALGRVFTAAEEDPNAPRTVVLSDALWKRRFGAARDVIGRTIRINDTAHEVIGVMPPGFQPPIVAPRAQLWQAFRVNPATAPRGAIILRAFAQAPVRRHGGTRGGAHGSGCGAR